MTAERTAGQRGPASRAYAGCVAALATRHGKEQAIAPPIAERLGLELRIPGNLDTDRLGTFTGEVPRPGTIEETAIRKARMGMQATGLSLGIASEGSYGPDPRMPLVPAGLELMVLVDDTRDIVIREHLVDPAPAYRSTRTQSASAIESWLGKAGFPSHALIVQPNVQDDRNPVFHKALDSDGALGDAIDQCRRLSEDGMALVTTDMRAHLNPTRMRTLGRLAARFAERIATACPACDSPGFGKSGVETGLPCDWCGAPSELVRLEIFGCVACTHRERRPRRDGLERADPAHCAHCNP